MHGNLALQITSRTAGRRAIAAYPGKPWPADAARGAEAMIPGQLADLVLLHRDPLLRYLRAHGAGDHAEDLLQDLWLKAGRSPMPADFSRNYLMRMAHNLVIDHARSARQRGRRDDSWYVDGPVGGSVDAAPDAERALIARERLHGMEAVLRALGARTEGILRRHRIDGVSQKQIADEQGLSLSAVEKHLQKAYRAIASARLEADAQREDGR